jgi:small-conductance mechanosensitive channel
VPTDCRSYALRSRILVALCLILIPAGAAAQGTPPPQGPQPIPAQGVSVSVGIEPSDEPATVMFSNRPIVELRARVMGRSPDERAATAERLLDDLADQGVGGPVDVRTFEAGRIVTLGTRPVLLLTSLDIDEAAGDTLDSVAAAVVAILRVAVAEAVEARTPSRLAWAALQSLLALGIGITLLTAIIRGHHRIARRLIATAERQVSRAGAGPLEVLRASRLFEFWRTFVSIVSVVLCLMVTYSVVTFTLRRFPYTRPWGESMREFMLAKVSGLALDMVSAVPALFTVVLIFLIARFVIRLLRLFFAAVEQGTVEVPWLHRDTAQPTRRLVATLLWIFAAVMAYPYLPGSGTDAFKGASVFIGLVVSLGSSGLVNQVMSSFMITYSRSLRLGDFVKVGEVEGTVNYLGVLSTKVRTVRGEEVTIPNAIVVGTTTTNYTRCGDVDGGIYTPTSLTIGYDTPWRQVRSLLLMAAERTPGLRASPEPAVRQVELQDFYVKYTLLVSLERPEQRALIMSTLHSNILDLFNEYGVQIMSPNYENDPDGGPKIVPKDQWHAAPAREEK